MPASSQRTNLNKRLAGALMVRDSGDVKGGTAMLSLWLGLRILFKCERCCPWDLRLPSQYLNFLFA
jgi:hypothetical protein